MGQSKWSKIIVGAVIITIVVGSGIYFWLSKETQTVPENSSAPAESLISEVEKNCKDSGGLFVNNQCQCSNGYTYESRPGFCIDAEGVPGGVFGEEVKTRNQLGN